MMNSKIFIAGHKGMVGSAILRQLLVSGHKSEDLIVKTHQELDLLNQEAVQRFFSSTKIDFVYIAAARVGGILANKSYPANYIYENLMIQSNLIHSAYLSGIKKILFLGSSCIYPVGVPQPMKEDALLTGVLEPTNEPYAIAKIAGIKLCESYNRQYGVDYRSVMPTNLYGPGDNFHSDNSHVIPGLIRRFHEAVKNSSSEVTVWGSGKPLREFLHVDDMAAASIFVMNLDEDNYKAQTQPRLSHINIGTGVEYSILELAGLIAKVTKFSGKIIFDSNKPDGTMRKVLDVSRINSLGWTSRIELEDGLVSTYKWFLNNQKTIRK